jgi:hypothetical protein
VKSEIDMLEPLSQDTNFSRWRSTGLAYVRTHHWLPSWRSGLKALILLPLAIPGTRVILSGLSWFDWLKFPGSWLVATIIFILMHLLLPMVIVSVFYYTIRSCWQIKSPISIYQLSWFAFSTIAIILLSFLGTMGMTALVESSSCQLFQSFRLAETCGNYFAAIDLQNLVFNLENYSFSYFQWFGWLTCAAYLYELQGRLLRS